VILFLPCFFGFLFRKDLYFRYIRELREVLFTFTLYFFPPLIKKNLEISYEKSELVNANFLSLLKEWKNPIITPHTMFGDIRFIPEIKNDPRWIALEDDDEKYIYFFFNDF
jgi:hypothetical protein